MLNSSSNFPSHTHTHTLDFTLNSGCVVSTSCQSSRECFNNRSVFITSLAVSLQDGPGQPCCPHISLISTFRRSRLSSPPPPAVGVGYVPKIPHAPHLLAEVGDVADDLASAIFFSLCGRVSRGLSSVLSKRERITAEISGSGEGSRNMQQTDKHRSKTGKVVVLTLNCGSTASTICFFNACLGCYRCGLPQRQARFKANGSPRRNAKFLGSKLNKLLMGEAFLSHYRTLPPECP